MQFIQRGTLYVPWEVPAKRRELQLLGPLTYHALYLQYPDVFLKFSFLYRESFTAVGPRC